MSASYSNSKFDDHIPSQYNSYGQPSSHTSPYTSTSSKRSPTAASAVHVNKALAKDARSGLSTPSSTETSGTSAQIRSEASRASADWNDDLSSNAQDSPEGQLVPGPPGIARRAKAHVPSACVQNGKEVRQTLNNGFPRLLAHFLQASCVDVQHKKRGRPRLREEDNLREMALGGESYSNVYQTQANSLAAAQPGRHRSKTYRELRSQPETSYVDQRPRTSDPAYSQHGQYLGGSLGYTTSAPAASYRSDYIPTVLLTPDFVVAQHNRAFSEALSLQITARGQTLLDLVVPAEREKIRRLQALMRTELQNDVRSAHKSGDLNMLNTTPPIERLDIIHATAGFQTRSEYWTFRLPRDQSRGFPISISLARDGGHFIILTLIQSANSLQAISSPPLLQQPSMVSSTSIGGIPSPPHTIYQGRQTHVPQHHRHQRNSPSDVGIPYLASSMPSTLEDQLLPLQPSHSLAQYKQTSPPRSIQMSSVSYSTSRTNSSSSASASGSDIPRSSPGHQHQAPSRDSLRHLQLPPILTTPTSDPNTPKESAERRRHQHSTPSPAGNSPHSGKRKKRRRVEIGDMLH
ncbi:MAG: hypothetical protein Q9217_004519 [Psora testacea]